MQLAAVTGIYGISFLVSWPASAINWAWEHRFDWSLVRRGTSVIAGVMAAVFLLGAGRLFWAAPATGQKRVAAIAAGNFPVFPSRLVEDRFWAGRRLDDGDLASVRAELAKRSESLFARSEHEVQAGAQLVFWSETAAWVLRADEPALIGRGSAFASRNHVYLGMALASIDPTRAKPTQDKMVLFGPDGRTLFDYWKSRPVPGAEKSMVETNGNPMHYADTPLGRIGGFICFDLDFPALVRQAGRAHVGLMIAPSNDWPAIDPWNTEMAAFRAIENGCTLVRDVSNGRSLAVDYLGRTLGETDFFQDPRHILVVDVPTEGVRTLYSRLGDLFGWLCVLSLVVIVIARWRYPRSQANSSILKNTI